jgi:hypothetical protein
MKMDALHEAARRFPLVARTRPACTPLDVRVREVGRLARGAVEGPDIDRLSLAAAAYNLAALIASDCGLPELAWSLCWCQFHVFERARPLTPRAGRYALEPLVNLARLRMRGGDGESAYQLLDALYSAVRFRTEAVIDGMTISFGDLMGADDHGELRRWLWAVLLADGTRALVSARRWDLAYKRAMERGGVGQRLLDGRQVAVLARLVAGDRLSALAVLGESALSTPWEQCVAACLGVLCLKSSPISADSAIDEMVQRCLSFRPTPGLLAFAVRLGLAVIDLAGGIERPAAAQVATHLVRQAVAVGDGYAARDVLAHAGCRSLLDRDDEQALSAAVQASGVGGGTIPSHLFADLVTAVDISERAAARCLESPAATGSATA